MNKKEKQQLRNIFKAIFFIAFWWVPLIIKILSLLINKSKKSTYQKKYSPTKNEEQEHKYESKGLLTDHEKYFFDAISNEFGMKYYIMPQVNLASVVNKIKDFPTQYQNELYRNIDIGIFDKSNMTPLLLIEINDKTHNQQKRIARDKKVHEICKLANLQLITFYSNYPNKREYIIKRINEALSNNSPNIPN